MMYKITGKNIEELTALQTSAFEKVIVDLGCGDGKQIYRTAANHPKEFFIGIDANASELEEISVKITKKAPKGGLSNIIYLKASAEELPKELENLVDEVHIHFPWGSLIEGIVKADEQILNQIKMIMKNNAELHVQLTYDDKYEGTYRAERLMPDLSIDYIQETLAKKYKELGFYLLYAYTLLDLEKQQIDSPWGKKILSKRDREVFKMQFRLKKIRSF